mmetsp:Transcript_5960/g.23122  ORF Transcript_5960/g.23122 Transcript_5960/m.23122 type:complete len:512 (+) Transcript_5960:274-1809(+)
MCVRTRARVCECVYHVYQPRQSSSFWLLPRATSKNQGAENIGRVRLRQETLEKPLDVETLHQQILRAETAQPFSLGLKLLPARDCARVAPHVRLDHRHVKMHERRVAAPDAKGEGPVVDDDEVLGVAPLSFPHDADPRDVDHHAVDAVAVVAREGLARCVAEGAGEAPHDTPLALLATSLTALRQGVRIAPVATEPRPFGDVARGSIPLHFPHIRQAAHAGHHAHAEVLLPLHLDELPLVVRLLRPLARGDVPQRLHRQWLLQDVRRRLDEATVVGVLGVVVRLVLLEEAPHVGHVRRRLAAVAPHHGLAGQAGHVRRRALPQVLVLALPLQKAPAAHHVALGHADERARLSPRAAVSLEVVVRRTAQEEDASGHRQPELLLCVVPHSELGGLRAHLLRARDGWAKHGSEWRSRVRLQTRQKSHSAAAQQTRDKRGQRQSDGDGEMRRRFPNRSEGAENLWIRGAGSLEPTSPTAAHLVSSSNAASARPLGGSEERPEKRWGRERLAPPRD